MPQPTNIRPIALLTATFHGRDIFAPVAAHLSIGTDSTGFMEIAVKNGHAASRLNVRKQDPVVLTAGCDDNVTDNDI